MCGLSVRGSTTGEAALQDSEHAVGNRASSLSFVSVCGVCVCVRVLVVGLRGRASTLLTCSLACLATLLHVLTLLHAHTHTHTRSTHEQPSHTAPAQSPCVCVWLCLCTSSDRGICMCMCIPPFARRHMQVCRPIHLHVCTCVCVCVCVCHNAHLCLACCAPCEQRHVTLPCLKQL